MSEELPLEENLRDWFKTRVDKKTGKKFKGWVNCKTGGPCGRKKAGKKGASYPACRPTHADCKKIKNKKYKKRGPARKSWKKKSENNEVPMTFKEFFKLNY